MWYGYARSIDNTSLRQEQGIKQYLGTGRAKCHYLGLTIRYRNDLNKLLFLLENIYVVQPRISCLRQPLAKGVASAYSLQYLVRSLCIPSRQKA